MILDKYLPYCSCHGSEVHDKYKTKFVQFRITTPSWYNACSVECLLELEKISDMPFTSMWDAKSKWWNYRSAFANLCFYLVAHYIQPKD